MLTMITIKIMNKYKRKKFLKELKNIQREREKRKRKEKEK